MFVQAAFYNVKNSRSDADGKFDMRNKMQQHKIDLHPISKDESTLYINEPWLVDKTLLEYPL